MDSEERKEQAREKGERQEQRERQAAPPDINDVWRELLGPEADALLQADAPGQAFDQAKKPSAGAEELPIVSGDPWAKLLHMKGLEQVDLQKVRLRLAQADDKDVEHALDAIREDTSK